jgi:hypothetical protein
METMAVGSSTDTASLIPLPPTWELPIIKDRDPKNTSENKTSAIDYPRGIANIERYLLDPVTEEEKD